MTFQRPIACARRCAYVLVLAAAAAPTIGCTPAMQKFSPSEIMHNLQPHRLQRLNRGPGMSSDAYFSVTDPIPGADDPTPAVNLGY